MSPMQTDAAAATERPAALAAIGSTPIVRLTRLAGPDVAEVWVKLEAANPTGSYKDRMALSMIEGAERGGRLAPGQTVVEYTGGSTGSSLAFVCALKGYPTRLVTSDAFAMARRAATEEGIWTGPSGGANLVAALRLAGELGPGARVVTIQPDSGLKYLGGELYS